MTSTPLLPDYVMHLTVDQFRAVIAEATQAPSVPEVMDASEAAAFLRISEYQLRQWAKDGTVPAAKLGKEWRFLRADLLLTLRTHTNTAHQGVRQPNQKAG